MTSRVIHIEALAPDKPVPGAPCNGCGVCCLFEPCPVGRVLSARRQGRCSALRWDERLGCYRCGAVDDPLSALRGAEFAVLRGLAVLGSPLLGRFARRWIAADQGCDCTLEVQGPAVVDDSRQN